MKETTSDDYFRSFVASKYNQELMKKKKMRGSRTISMNGAKTCGPTAQ